MRFFSTMLLALVAGSAQSQTASDIRLLVEVLLGEKVVLRETRNLEPLAPYTLPVGMINNQPTVLKCESKFVTAYAVRTLCRTSSGAEQARISNPKWVESRIGVADTISFQEPRMERVVIKIQPIFPDKKTVSHAS